MNGNEWEKMLERIRRETEMYPADAVRRARERGIRAAQSPRWGWGKGVAAAVLLAVGGGMFAWFSGDPGTGGGFPSDPNGTFQERRGRGTELVWVSGDTRILWVLDPEFSLSDRKEREK